MKLKDGTIVHPVRGKAPEPIEGYGADPLNPFIHRLTLRECEHREYLEPDCNNCGKSATMHCQQMENDETWKPFEHKQISRMDCKNCPFEEQPQSSSPVSVEEEPNSIQEEDIATLESI